VSSLRPRRAVVNFLGRSIASAFTSRLGLEASEIHRMSRIGRQGFASSLALLLAPAASAQYGNEWLTLSPALDRLKTPSGAVADIVANTDEKDFVAGDVNRDGWQDVVVGLKLPNSFPGKRPARLFLNEKGTLVDRTAQYGVASTSPNDLGLSEPLDCRDFELADLDGDGWLDLVGTQTDLTNDTTTAGKRLTHPRIYMNLGADLAGNWLGFQHEDARIPQLVVVNTGVNGIVRFCDGAVGDVDLDGDVDLYFVDYDTDENGHVEPSALDLNDRLLLNDGNGYFTDVTFTNFKDPAMWSSAFGTECVFADANGDGKPDILKVSTLTDTPNRIDVIYNNAHPVSVPNYTGGFDLASMITTSSPYGIAVADLNNDARLDVVIGDDAIDGVVFNNGNNALGQVIWTPFQQLSWLAGSGDDGFPGQLYANDFNLDGWRDALITDVDVDLPGCNRRTKIYHNRTGVPGTSIILREEAEMAGANGWKGAIGWSSAGPTGVFDAGIADIDHDGDEDILLGRCIGTEVWMNQTNPVICQQAVPTATIGDAALTVCGQPLWSNLSAVMRCTNGPANGNALLLVSLTPSTLNAFGGQVLSSLALTLTLPLDGSGSVALPVPGGFGTAAGLSIYVQALLVTPGFTALTDISTVVRLDMRS
jgi:FG-GAP-like repeat